MRRLVTLTLALAVAIPALAAEDTIRRGFNVADGGTLRLTAGIGDVTVVTGGTGVAIEIIRESDGRRGEELMREHDIDIRQSGNDVIIDGKLDRDNGWFRMWDGDDYEVKWNIRVPARYNVDLSTSGGSINLADMGGRVEAKTSGGSIKAGRLGGTANLRTSGGSITVAGASGNVNAHTSGGSIDIGNTTGVVEAKTSGGGIRLGRIGGNVVARTSGGSIRIDDAAGAVEASTSGGSITATISRQPDGDSSFSTSGGGVAVNLASGISVEVDAKASGGGVRSDVPVTVQGTQDEDSLQGRIGRGGPRLVMRTSGGSIRLKAM
jgi:DUF4097 and DUF4098 domain-containing protein YvlB